MLLLVQVQSNKQPIGIFDSGIGGLTVAKAITKLMPHENIVYFGDTAHLPYGEKSSESIQHYSKKITSFLLAQDCKMVIIACNTASAVGYKALKPLFADKQLLVNVIDPVAKYITQNIKSGNVGIIATKRTVKTRAYSKKINKAAPNLQTTELATPLLAPMIEEGFFNNKISQTIIDNYLGKRPLKEINALVLGCTHYPLIQQEIEKCYAESNKKVEVIDSATIVAKEVQSILIEKGLNTKKGNGQYRFFVSDYTPAFEKTAKLFFGEKVKLEQYPLWR